MDGMLISLASGLVLGMLALALGSLVIPAWRAGDRSGAGICGVLALLCMLFTAWLVMALPAAARLPLLGGYVSGVVVVSLLGGLRGAHGHH